MGTAGKEDEYMWRESTPIVGYMCVSMSLRKWWPIPLQLDICVLAVGLVIRDGSSGGN